MNRANTKPTGKRGSRHAPPTNAFPVGVSGNPDGRPKDDPEFIEACRAHTMDALATLAKAMAGYAANPGPAVKAAEVLLNRGWGTAPQTIKLDAKLQAEVTHALQADPRTPGWELRVAAVLLQAGALEAKTETAEPVEARAGLAETSQEALVSDAAPSPTTRIVIAGGPRTGKTTLAATMGRPVRHGDDLIGTHEWSEASAEIAQWLSAPGPWVVEGVQCARALRKWLPTAPADLSWLTVYNLTTPRTAQTGGQLTMAKGCATVWAEIQAVLRQRGARVLEPR